jgi:hypothetical protein
MFAHFLLAHVLHPCEQCYNELREFFLEVSLFFYKFGMSFAFLSEFWNFDKLSLLPSHANPSCNEIVS